MTQEKRKRGCRGCLIVPGVLLLVGVVILVGLGVAWFLYTQGKPATGLLSELQGVVQTRAESETQWNGATNNQKVAGGERVKTGDASAVTIVFFDTSSVDLDENTEVSVLDAFSTRGEAGGNLMVKNWAGRTSVRMVRFTDPTSEFVVETPTASTTIRGAQADVTVGSDGTTDVSVEVGSAVVTGGGASGSALPGEEVSKSMGGDLSLVATRYQQGGSMTVTAGQMATIDPSGGLNVTQVYTPSPDALTEAVEAAFDAPGTTWTLTVTERMVNDFLASTTTGIQQLGISVPTIWFSENSIILGGELSGEATGLPVSGPFTIVASPSADASGALRLNITAFNVGGVPLPAGVTSPALSAIEGTVQDMVTDPDTPATITSIVVEEGSLTLSGTKAAP
jgi:cytoskeletal protein RodZ